MVCMITGDVWPRDSREKREQPRQYPQQPRATPIPHHSKLNCMQTTTSPHSPSKGPPATTTAYQDNARPAAAAGQPPPTAGGGLQPPPRTLREQQQHQQEVENEDGGGGFSMWGRLSSFTQQFNQITRDAIQGEEDEMDSVLAELEEVRAELEHMTTMVEAQNIKIKHYEQEVLDLRQQQTAAELQIASVNSEYRKMIKEKEAALSMLKSECSKLKDDNERLQHSLYIANSQATLYQRTEEGAPFQQQQQTGNVGAPSPSTSPATDSPLAISLLGTQLKHRTPQNSPAAENHFSEELQKERNEIWTSLRASLAELGLSVDDFEHDPKSLPETIQWWTRQFGALLTEANAQKQISEAKLVERTKQLEQRIEEHVNALKQSEAQPWAHEDTSNMKEAFPKLLNELNVSKMTADKLQKQNDELARRLSELEEGETNAKNEETPTGLSVDTYEKEIEQLKAKLEKSQNTLSRLRAHLIEQEELHNKELLESENRVKELQQRIARYVSQQNAIDSTTERYQKLLKDYEEKEAECTQTTQALLNLQNVLEQFQAQQDSLVRFEVSALSSKLEKQKEECQHLREQCAEYKLKEKRLELAEKTIEQLRDDLNQKSREIIKYQEEVEPLREALEESLRRLRNAAENGKNLVDRRLVSKLFVTYFERSDNRLEILNLMASILEFSEEEKSKVGLMPLNKGSGWSLFGRRGGSDKQKEPEDIKTQRTAPTLTDLWVEFLLKEASSAAQQQQATNNIGKGGDDKNPGMDTSGEESEVQKNSENTKETKELNT